MTTDPRERYYQLVFIRMNDAEKFARYCDLARPVVEPYGGALERMLAPDALHGESMARPDIVNIVHYDSRDAFESLHRDPRFREIVHLRTESIEMAQAGGPPTRGAVTADRLDRRLYLVEVARFGPRGADGYQQYEQEAEPLMARHGYRVERVLIPDSSSGFPFEPDIVKIACFPDAECMERMHRDPAHARIENELYPSAVAQSTWLTASVHPAARRIAMRWPPAAALGDPAQRRW